MKFKFIFIVLNVIILLFLGFVLLIPYLVLGQDFVLTFWSSSWPLIIILVLVLTALNIFYFTNKKLFFLLEREDWPGLVYYLEDRVIKKSHYSSRLVRLLANTYLVLSDSASVNALEKKAALAKPSLLNTHCLVFGVARVLGRDYEGAAQFFEKRLGSPRTESPEWVRWYYGFSQLLNEHYSQAADGFILLVKEGRDPLVISLSAFFLEDTLAKALPARRDELRHCAGDGKNRVRKFLPSRTAWKKDAAKMQNEIYAAIIMKYISGAEQWIYSAQGDL